MSFCKFMLPNIPLNPVPENRELLHSHSPFPSMLCECVCAVGAEGENPVQRRLLPSTREGEAYIISQERGGGGNDATVLHTTTRNVSVATSDGGRKGRI